MTAIVNGSSGSANDIASLTAMTAPTIDDVLQIVDDPAGSPADYKIAVGDLLGLEFGSIYVAGGSATQSPGATYALCNQFVSNGLSSTGVTPVVASDKITLVATGIYLVGYSVSYVGNNSATTGAAVFWNGVEQSQIAHQRTMGAAAAIGVAAQFGLVDATTASKDIDLRIKVSAGVFDVKEATLFAVRLKNT